MLACRSRRKKWGGVSDIHRSQSSWYLQDLSKSKDTELEVAGDIHRSQSSRAFIDSLLSTGDMHRSQSNRRMLNSKAISQQSSGNVQRWRGTFCAVLGYLVKGINLLKLVAGVGFVNCSPLRAQKGCNTRI